MTEREIFVAAFQRTNAAERDNYLDDACGPDLGLRCRVESLLGLAEGAGSFLEQPATPLRFDLETAEFPPGDSMPTAAFHEPLAAGNLIAGKYKLLERIGEGGMGEVYLAQQTAPVKRLVALKVIKAGMDSRQVLARFEVERQALALMDHPNIAKVLDAGFVGVPALADPSEDRLTGGLQQEGRPYFVMELVKGVPITKFCDERKLPPRERLELFLPVCHAIQHAHQKGIIHRDIKPTNVLVALYDGRPVPKVIDFGVAKAAGQPLTERTLVTGLGAVVGTPEYMSPEQAELNPVDIDTRSDVYSLGVLLYELLTGTTPLTRKRIRDASLLELLRVIREEETQKPSTRLSTVDELRTIAANRGTEPARLSRLVQGELDWVVMKALEKDRSRRYETANGLAADVQRHLAGEPVLAAPPSAWYRYCKFARRNKRGLATVSVVAFAVLLAVGALAISYGQVSEALRTETQAREDLGRILEREKQTTYLHGIARADYAIANNNWGEANDLLDEYLPSGDGRDRRGWEWYYLKRLLDAPLHEVTAAVNSVQNAGPDLAFSSDGRLLAAPSHGSIVLWDIATGQQWSLKEQPEDGLQRPILQVAFSPDGRSLVSACEGGRVLLWNLDARRPDLTKPRTLIKLDQPGVGLAFSPDGRHLATAGPDKWVRLWDTASWQELYKFESDFPKQSLLPLAFSPNSQLLACAGERTVKIREVATRREVYSLVGHTEPVFSVDFSADGDRLVSVSADLTARVWNLAEGGQELFSVHGHPASSRAVALSHDGSRLAVAGGAPEPDIWIYDAKTGRLLQTLVGHRNRVHALAFHPDGQRLVSSGTDRTVRIWDLGRGREALRLRKQMSVAEAVRFDPKGWRLVSAGSDGQLRIWDGTPPGKGTSRKKVVLSGHTHQVYDVDFSPDSPYLASASGDGTVRVWNWVTGREAQILEGQREPVCAVVFGADGLLVSASEREAVRFWDARTGKPTPLRLEGIETRARKLALSPDSKLLVTCGAIQPYPVCLWDARTGKKLHQLKGHKDIVLGVAFSPDSRFVATTSSDRTVRIWDSATGEEACCFENQYQGFSVVFSPDGRYLAAGFEQEAKVWEWQTRKELTALTGHTHYIYSVAYSPNGRWLASASWRDVIIWDASTGQTVRRLDRQAGSIQDVEWSPDGRRLAVASARRGGEIELWDVSDLEKN